MSNGHEQLSRQWQHHVTQLSLQLEFPIVANLDFWKLGCTVLAMTKRKKIAFSFFFVNQLHIFFLHEKWRFFYFIISAESLIRRSRKNFYWYDITRFCPSKWPILVLSKCFRMSLTQDLVLIACSILSFVEQNLKLNREYS